MRAHTATQATPVAGDPCSRWRSIRQPQPAWRSLRRPRRPACSPHYSTLCWKTCAGYCSGLAESRHHQSEGWPFSRQYWRLDAMHENRPFCVESLEPLHMHRICLGLESISLPLWATGIVCTFVVSVHSV
jgi:hypothetical protein